jgi:hypothetical protein
MPHLNYGGELLERLASIPEADEGIPTDQFERDPEATLLGGLKVTLDDLKKLESAGPVFAGLEEFANRIVQLAARKEVHPGNGRRGRLDQ